MRPTHKNLMYPGIGVGGYCLTKDPLLASWSKQNLFEAKKGLDQSIKGVQINDKMPLYAYQFLKKEINNLNRKKILLLGVSYRSDVGDTRFTPVEPFYNYLIKDGAKIQLHDPYVRFWDELGLEVDESIDKVFQSELNVVVITTAHKEYKNSEYLIKLLLKQETLFIFDTVGLFTNSQISQLSEKQKVRVVGRGDII